MNERTSDHQCENTVSKRTAIGVSVHIMEAYIVLFIGMEFVHDQALMIELGILCVTTDTNKWDLLMKWQHGTSSLDGKPEMYYTEAEIICLQLSRIHPHDVRLFNIIKKVRDDKAGGELWKKTKDLSLCKNWDTYIRKPFRFRALITP